MTDFYKYMFYEKLNIYDLDCLDNIYTYIKSYPDDTYRISLFRIKKLLNAFDYDFENFIRDTFIENKDYIKNQPKIIAVKVKTFEKLCEYLNFENCYKFRRIFRIYNKLIEENPLLEEEETGLKFTDMFEGDENRLRITSDNKVCVDDLIRVSAEIYEPEKIWEEIIKKHKYILEYCDEFTFLNQNKSHTVIDNQGIIKLLWLLPGKTVKKFRGKSAENLIKYLGADSNLIYELKNFKKSKIQTVQPLNKTEQHSKDNIQNLLVKEFQEHNITIYGTYNNPLFKAKDIGELLGIKNIRDTIKDFSNKQKVVVLTDTLGGQQETLFLTEKGLYKVLMKSRKPIAEKFQDWVCEVIEQIRKTGKYETEKYIEDRAKSNLLVEQSVDKSINYIGVVEETENNMIVKYGRTNYIRETLNRHQITYGENFYFIHTVECDRNHDLEKLIQNHDSLKNRHIKVYKENPRQELLKLDNNFTKKDLIKLVEDLKETLSDKHVLDLEKEKTKQIEAQTIQEKEKTKQIEAQTIQEKEKTKQLQIELEILKLKIAHGLL